MTLYSSQSGLSTAIHATINRGLRHSVDPERGILPELLRGTSKILVIHWYGPLSEAGISDQWDPERGDGEIELRHDFIHPSADSGRERGLRWPLNIDYQGFNIRMGVPLWVVGHRPGATVELVPLASGLYHPLFCSAHLDIWSPEDGRHLRRYYFLDPRSSEPSTPQPLIQRWVIEQKDELACMGAKLVEPHPLRVSPLC